LRNCFIAWHAKVMAMEISGHKIRAVFGRYHIVSERRMRQNARKFAQHLKAKEKENSEKQ